jgi:DNA-binding NtrC family response regulator
MVINVNRVLYKDKINQKLLIVDDEKGIQNLTKIVFNKFGYEVDTANNGLEGLNMYKKNEYCCVISDSTMPVMTGPEMYKRIKQHDPNANFIFITGDKNLLEKTIKNEYIKQKPFGINEFNEINYKIQERLYR